MLEAGHFGIRRFYPESFVITFSTLALKYHMMNLGGVVHHRFVFIFNHWCRKSNVVDITAASKVHLELEGIPPHAWSE